MKTVKNLLPRIVLTLLIFAFYVSCEPIKKEEPDGEQEEIAERPKQVIPLEEARILYKTYDERRAIQIGRYEDSINRATGVEKKFDVARYVRFDYQTIKSYMAFIEKEAEAAKVDIASLRIYFANNPDSDSTRVHPRQNSVMLSPTLDRRGEEFLFAIDTTSKESPKAVLLKADFEPMNSTGKDEGMQNDNKMEASIIPSLESRKITTPPLFFENIESLTLNRGNSAPPPPYQ